MSDKCTWRLVDEEYVLYETSCCDELMGSEYGGTLEEAGQTICPECGREIKVIEVRDQMPEVSEKENKDADC